MKNKILIVSYYYPPYRMGGGKRMSMLAEFLRKSGHSVTVLCAGNSEAEGTVYINDRINRDSIKKRAFFLKYINPLPDSMFAWSFKAANYVHEHAAEFDRIIVSFPPFTSALFTAFSINIHNARKFILDARDPWFNSPYSHYLGFLDRYIDKFAERFTFIRFRNKVVVTEGMKNHYSHLSNVNMISNAADSERCRNEKIRDFVYAGKMDHLRFNRNFIRAWNIFSENGSSIDLAGPGTESLALLNSACHGTLDAESTHRLLCESRFAVIMLNHDIKGFEQFMPSKLYEYIACGLPVFYAGPKSDASEFIEKNNAGVAVTDNNIESITEGLKMISGGNYSVPESLSESVKPDRIFAKYLELLRTA